MNEMRTQNVILNPIIYQIEIDINKFTRDITYSVNYIKIFNSRGISIL